VLIAAALCYTLGCCDCRTTKQEHRRLSFSRSFDTTETSLYLPSIIDELRSEDYDVDILPYFQRISVSGEEMSGVSMLLYIIQRLLHAIILADSRILMV